MRLFGKKKSDPEMFQEAHECVMRQDYKKAKRILRSMRGNPEAKKQLKNVVGLEKSVLRMRKIKDKLKKQGVDVHVHTSWSKKK